jgi:ActR/RegA family two-component response regulator
MVTPGGKELSILIVDDDALVLRSIVRQLQHENLHVMTAQNLNDALPVLLSRSVDILLTDLRLAEGEGTELLWVVHNNALKTKTILMSGCASEEDERLAFKLGATAVLEKPLRTDELASAISRAFDESNGFSGELFGMSIIDVLQMYHMNRRSIVLEVAGPHSACVYMDAGEVVHTTYGQATGEEAFRHILRLQSGRLRSSPLLRKINATISRRFDTLLLDGLRLNDEAERRGTDAAA